MPEETEDYTRIPVSTGHDGHRIRTITIGEEGDGIKALYCGECEEVITYLFEKAKDWTMEKAKDWVEEHKKTGKALTEEQLTSIEASTAIKSLGNGRVGGYLMVWGSPTLKDLENTYFAPDTELCLDWFTQRPILYEHGQDGAIKQTPMGQFTTQDMRADEVGMWMEGQLDARKRYLAAVEKLIGMGVLNWSSRSLPDLMEIAPDGRITKWPLIEATMTTHPAELRFTDVQSVKAFFQEAGLELPQQLIAGAQGKAGAGASGQASGVELRRRRLRLLEAGLNTRSKGA